MPLYRTLPRAEITCLDYSPDMMAQAQEKARRIFYHRIVQGTCASVAAHALAGSRLSRKQSADTASLLCRRDLACVYDQAF
ncbi:MAG: class I SAM-dependent methyltransferase [Oscillospiraceae bacterium]